jgi:GDPmannose 4,6-dehydratase
MAKQAFITGITGQDGSYLAELLIEKGYRVHGLVRRTSMMQRGRLDGLKISPEKRKDQLFLHYGDLGESTALIRLFHKIQPDEIYHLGGQSHVGVSFESPEYTFDVNASGTVRLLECLRGIDKPVRFYHASTCEMYGRPVTNPQDEKTAFNPVSPYACAKAASHFLTACYRDSYSLFACNGILFNHESPRRGENFVTRKIAQAAVRIKHGLQKKVRLGSLDARKDWGYAPEYVEAMWMMLQHPTPGDYVIATGKSHTVREFVEAAFQCVGLNWQDHVEIDPGQVRPLEVGLLLGNPAKAEKDLGWKPRVSFQELVNIMVESEIKALKV